jgi:hypothetical protein
MNTKLLLTTVAGMTLLTGCWSGPLMSLHPLYTENDLASDPALKGSWKLDEHCVLTIRQSAKNHDELVCSEKDGDNKMVVHVVQLAGLQVLDFVEGEDTGGIPGHGFAKIDLVSRDEMSLAFFGSEWLDKKIAERGIAHEMVGENGDKTVLTAPTRELQQFVLSYASQPEAFEEHDTLLRLP